MVSADNGIYIHRFRNGWAVIEAQAIENVFWNKGNKKYNYNILYDYFKGAPRFKTQEEAMKYAVKLYNEIMDSGSPILEYGISDI